MIELKKNVCAERRLNVGYNIGAEVTTGDEVDYNQ